MHSFLKVQEKFKELYFKMFKMYKVLKKMLYFPMKA